VAHDLGDVVHQEGFFLGSVIARSKERRVAVGISVRPDEVVESEEPILILSVLELGVTLVKV